MGWLDDLFGTGTKFTDKDIATDILKDSKFAQCSLAMAISETINPELRQILKRQVNDGAKAHFRLADMATHNDWYKPNLTPEQQILNDYQEAANLNQYE